MKIILSIFFLLILNSTVSYSQISGNKLVIDGDVLKGKTVDGVNIREVIGNVVITQEDVRITCEKAIHYINSNNAELIGNVVITQDSVIIKTERGRYFGDIKIAYSDSTVFLNNDQMDLIADRGNYNLRTKIANFFGNVDFQDSATILKSTQLVYNKNLEKIIAVGNVVVSDSLSEIKADSLIHDRNTKFSEGVNNIIIKNLENNLTIFGQHLLDDKLNKFSQIKGDPFLVQIEKLSNGLFDTLYIKSNEMEARKDSTGSILIATDSVKILRGGFISKNDYTIYDKSSERITILKQENMKSPILWYDNNQVIGDSIYIYLDSSKIKNVSIVKDAILISQDSTFDIRYNQMSGDTILMSFSEGKLSKTKVDGNVLSIYYLYEEGEPNGLLKSSANEIAILFEKGKVKEVKMFGSPISEYHPENLVIDNEKNFTLPAFFIDLEKPKKSEFYPLRKYMN